MAEIRYRLLRMSGCLLFCGRGGTSFRDCDHCVMKFKKMFGQNLILDLKMVLQWHNLFITRCESEQESYM